jgi:hypothetical protein
MMVEEAINFYSVEDKEGLPRDLICRERKQKYYRLNAQNQLKTNYIYYTLYIQQTINIITTSQHH